MNKTILIPTDFTIGSLSVLKSFLNNNTESNAVYEIVLLHEHNLSSSITELLFFSKSNLINSLTNKEFEDACVIIKNKYASQVKSIRKDVFTGFTQNAFNNYISANKIDEACLPFGQKKELLFNANGNLFKYIKKSNITIHEINLPQDDKLPEKGKLAEMFYNGSVSVSQTTR